MTKFINADDFLLQYSILISRPSFMPFSAEMSTWELWKQEFDRSVQMLVSRMVTEREDDEQKFIAKIKEIPVAQIPIVCCKECIHKDKAKVNSKGFLICPASGMEICDNDYCSYAERKSKVKRCFDIPENVANMLLKDTERKEETE